MEKQLTAIRIEREAMAESRSALSWRLRVRVALSKRRATTSEKLLSFS